MKLIILIILLLINSSCAYKKLCKGDKFVKRQIDLSKEYVIKGKYCIDNIKDTTIGNGDCAVVFNVFDRLTREQFRDRGVAIFYGKDTSSILFKEDGFIKRVKAGSYYIVVTGAGYAGTKTKKITLQENTLVKISFFLGYRVQF